MSNIAWNPNKEHVLITMANRGFTFEQMGNRFGITPKEAEEKVRELRLRIAQEEQAKNKEAANKILNGKTIDDVAIEQNMDGLTYTGTVLAQLYNELGEKMGALLQMQEHRVSEEDLRMLILSTMVETPTGFSNLQALADNIVKALTQRCNILPKFKLHRQPTDTNGQSNTNEKPDASNGSTQSS